jgi:uncharacterized protein (TIGR02466 family)
MLSNRPGAMTPDRRLSIENIDLFPTRIWQSRLTGQAHLFAGWISTVNALRAASPTPAGRSNRLGWNSSDKAVLNHPSFAELNAALRACSQHALRQMGYEAPTFDLESWINIHDRGGFNFLHIHDNTRLSGVFYLQVPSGSGSLVFRDPRSGVVNSPFKGSSANAHNDVQLSPEVGLVAMFPHWLEHHVEPHDNDIPRISISFNAI